MLCCGYTLTDFLISIRLTSLALWQSDDCPSASKATLMNMDKYFIWIHYERLHNHNKAKHNKTVCVFLGIYCISDNRRHTVTIDSIVSLGIKGIYGCSYKNMSNGVRRPWTATDWKQARPCLNHTLPLNILYQVLHFSSAVIKLIRPLNGSSFRPISTLNSSVGADRKRTTISGVCKQ